MPGASQVCGIGWFIVAQDNINLHAGSFGNGNTGEEEYPAQRNVFRQGRDLVRPIVNEADGSGLLEKETAALATFSAVHRCSHALGGWLI